jgi:hypothetical protein
MELEQPLKLFWYPAEFSSKLGKDILIPLELFGEPWVLFRDERGSPSCIRDQCAHRACPLSIGKVVDGQVSNGAQRRSLWLAGRQGDLISECARFGTGYDVCMFSYPRL